MKTHYVYELYNLLGSLEYVGETCNPKVRMYHHTKIKPIVGSGCGKFYGRSDIFMHLVKEFDNKKDSFRYQCQLQQEYGMITDREKLIGPESEETKRKKSLAKLGKPCPQWVKDKISATKRSKS